MTQTPYTPSLPRDNLLSLIAADTALSRAHLSLPPLAAHTEQVYRDRAWLLIKAFRRDWQDRGVVFLGHHIQTRQQDETPILTESVERLLGYRKLGAWLTEDNQAVTFTNDEFLNLGAAIAHYAEDCLTSAQQFRKLLAEMSFDDLRRIPTQYEELRDWIESGTKVKWPSNVYDEPPRNMVLADGAVANLVKRLEIQEQLISKLEEKLKEPQPEPFPSGVTCSLTSTVKKSRTYIYIDILNQTEADLAIGNWAIALDFITRHDRRTYGCTMQLQKNGLTWVRPNVQLISEGKKLRVPIHVYGTKIDKAELVGLVRFHR